MKSIYGAFWLLKIVENDIEKTAFSTPDGHYEFLRLPFGVTNGTRAFQRLMFNIYGHKSFIEIYLDNLIMHSKDKESHFEFLTYIFEKAREKNLKLNLKKCKFFQKQIKLLGHIITKNKVMMDPSKIEKVKNWQIPNSAKQVQQFLGLANYYHHFIKNFAEIASPLYQLTTKNNLFKWTEESNTAFQLLKEKLCSYPILRSPNLTLPFTVFTDASALSAGAILSQTDEEGEYVISYNSKTFKNAELHYSVTEKECLAVLFAVKSYRIYLDGVHFKIITDHRALKWLMDITDPHGRLARWAIYLQSYNFTIQDRPGIQHVNADAMSRITKLQIANITQNENDNDLSQKSLDVWEDSTLLYYLKNLKHKPGSSKKQVKRIIKLAQHYIYEQSKDKIWYHSENEEFKKILEVPKIDERLQIILKVHLFGHRNARKTFDQLKDKYFWRNMMKNIDTIIRNCIECLKHKRIKLNEHPAIALSIHTLMERIGIDLAFGLPMTEEGYHGVLVIIEYLSKYPYAVPIKSKTAEEISGHIFIFISMFGPPEEMMHDQGKEFVNNTVEELIKSVGTENLITSSYNPRTDGLCEKENQTLFRMIRKHADKNPTEWHKWLPYCLMAIRDTVHSTTGFTPYELLFGRPMNKFINYIKDENEVKQTEITKRLEEIKIMFEETIPQAITNIEKSQITQKLTQEKRANIQTQPLKVKMKFILMLGNCILKWMLIMKVLIMLTVLPDVKITGYEILRMSE